MDYFAGHSESRGPGSPKIAGEVIISRQLVGVVRNKLQLIMVKVELGERSEAMKAIKELSESLNRYIETPEQERRRSSTDSAM